jgi:uncharacterized oligopeptide transporter (OPT) family protein
MANKKVPVSEASNKVRLATGIIFLIAAGVVYGIANVPQLLSNDLLKILNEQEEWRLFILHARLVSIPSTILGCLGIMFVWPMRWVKAG